MRESNDLPDLNLTHLLNMTDDTGMLQHAIFSVPNTREGYTTDDNARALIVSNTWMRLCFTGVGRIIQSSPIVIWHFFGLHFTRRRGGLRTFSAMTGNGWKT